MKSFIKNLPESVKDSLSWYTGGNFDKLNFALRNNKPLTSIQKMHKDNIDMAFDAAPRIKKSITVYKGKNSSNVYSDKSYISTSKNIEAAYDFSGTKCCILVITVTPGSKVLDISYLSRYKDENEILLDRGGSLFVTNTYIENDMKFINCVYTNGVKVKSNMSISKAEKIVKLENDDTDVINRLFKFFKDDYDPYFTDEDEIKSIYSKMYPSRKINNKVIKKVIKMLIGQ